MLLSATLNGSPTFSLTQGDAPLVELRIIGADGKYFPIQTPLSGMVVKVPQTSGGPASINASTINTVLTARGIVNLKFTAAITNNIPAGKNTLQVEFIGSDGYEYVAVVPNGIVVREKPL